MLTYHLYKISFVNLDLGYGAAMSFFLLAVILASTGMIYLLWGAGRSAGDAPPRFLARSCGGRYPPLDVFCRCTGR